MASRHKPPSHTKDNTTTPHISCSYTICKQDPICHYHMYMEDNGDNTDAFRFVYESMLRHMHINDTQASKFCSNTSDTELWLIVMRSYRYCKDANEYFNRHTGCICRGGMICEITAAEYHSFFPATDIVLGVSTLLVLSFYIIRTYFISV